MFIGHVLAALPNIKTSQTWAELEDGAGRIHSSRIGKQWASLAQRKKL